MPYIKKEDRYRLYAVVQEMIDCAAEPKTPGELNYLFTEIIKVYLSDKSGEYALSYQKINDAIGVLGCCTLELYRRLGANYEDAKIAENGDVY